MNNESHQSFVIALIVSFALSLIPEHYKWFDVGLGEIIFFTFIIYPVVMGVSMAIQDLFAYRSLYFALDSFGKGFRKPFSIISDYCQSLRDDSEQYRFFSDDDNLKRSIRVIWENFNPQNVTYSQYTNQFLLKTMIQVSIDDDDYDVKDKVCNAFGSTIFTMKNRTYVLDRITRDALNRIYIKYMELRRYPSWEGIYDFSYDFINFIELYNFALQQYEYSRSSSSYSSYGRSSNSNSSYSNYGSHNSSGSNRSSHSSSNGYRSKAQTVNRYEEHYKALKVSSTATFTEVKASYRKLMKANHPDRFVNSDEATKKKANDICQKITASYSVLKKAMDG